MKPFILVDIHDTVNDLLDKLVKWYNIINNTNIRVEDVTQWDLVPLFGKNIYRYFGIPELFKHLDVKPDAERVLHRLKPKYTLVAVTSVNRKYTDFQRYWIDTHLPMVFDHVVIARDKGCFRKVAYAAIDDNPSNLDAMPAIHKLLMNSPHNQTASDYERVYDWLDIERRLF